MSQGAKTQATQMMSHDSSVIDDRGAQVKEKGQAREVEVKADLKDNMLLGEAGKALFHLNKKD